MSVFPATAGAVSNTPGTAGLTRVGCTSAVRYGDRTSCELVSGPDSWLAPTVGASLSSLTDGSVLRSSFELHVDNYTGVTTRHAYRTSHY